MPSGGNNKIARSDLLEELHRLAAELGETPTRAEMNEEGEFSGSAYRTEFGSWNESLEAAGLEKNHVFNKERTEYECPNCGDTVLRLESSVDGDRSFCDRECKREWQETDWGGEDHPLTERIEVECAWCGTSLSRKPSHAKTRERFFCGYDCFGEWASENRRGPDSPRWKGGGDLYYGENWRKQRRKCLERDGHTCQWCGRTEDESQREYGRSLSVHHKRPMREFVEGEDEPDYEAANALENLVTLCLPCHRTAERLPVQPQFD